MTQVWAELRSQVKDGGEEIQRVATSYDPPQGLVGHRVQVRLPDPLIEPPLKHLQNDGTSLPPTQPKKFDLFSTMFRFLTFSAFFLNSVLKKKHNNPPQPINHQEIHI